MVFFSRLFSPNLEIEVINACLNKLPKVISVSWFRDEGFIVGKIFLDKHSEPILTQARTPEEFIKMVNDAVYVALDFKQDYIEYFHRQKDVYAPPREALEALKTGTNGQYSFGFENRLKENLVPVAA